MMNRNDFQQLALLRLREARNLLNNGFPDGAYYLGGYAVECAIKACIAKATQMHDFPDKKRVDESHSHDLSKLLTIADLRIAFEKDRQSDPVLEADWRAVEQWNERSRYERGKTQPQADDLLRSIRSNRQGVMPWIEQHW